MAEPEWTNGKATLDRCYFCYQSKDVVRKSQQYRQNLYCVGLSDTEAGQEVAWERDRHKFTVTKKFWDIEQELEKQMYDDMANMYDFISKDNNQRNVST